MAYLAIVSLWAGVAWGTHLAAGAVVMCVAVGVLVSLLVFPPGTQRATEVSR